MNIDLIKMYLSQMVFKKAKVFFFRWLTTTALYKKLLKDVVPYIRLTTYYTKMRGWKYHRGYALLQEGDIILTKDKFKLTTKIIGGEWAHAGYCVSKDGKFEIAEMTHTDYTKSTFSDLCYEADEVAILRCKDFDPDYVKNKVTPKCLSLSASEYDVEFKFGEKFIYCSELIYISDVEKRLDVNLDDLAQLGREYISPTGLWQAKNIEVIWLSSKEIL